MLHTTRARIVVWLAGAPREFFGRKLEIRNCSLRPDTGTQVFVALHQIQDISNCILRSF